MALWMLPLSTDEDPGLRIESFAVINKLTWCYTPTNVNPEGGGQARGAGVRQGGGVRQRGGFDIFT